MEGAIATIVSTFEKYADGDGKLSRSELEKLIENEFPDKHMRVPEKRVNKILERADKDDDGGLDFKEFCKVVACITKRFYNKKAGKAEED